MHFLEFVQESQKVFDSCVDIFNAECIFFVFRELKELQRCAKMLLFFYTMGVTWTIHLGV